MRQLFQWLQLSLTTFEIVKYHLSKILSLIVHGQSQTELTCPNDQLTPGSTAVIDGGLVLLGKDEGSWYGTYYIDAHITCHHI